MEAIVDQETCICCGLCSELCPEVFEIGDNGKAHVLCSPVPQSQEQCCRDASEQCPVQAISISPLP
jgi:ferredoxin